MYEKKGAIWYFQTFDQTNKYNVVYWLFLMSLDKAVKKQDHEFKFQVQGPQSDPKASMCTLKGTLISYSHSIHIAENETQNLILWLAKLQYKLDSQSCKRSTV